MQKGGGRKFLEYHQPDMVRAIESLVEPTERGDPQSTLRWTCKSVANLVGELCSQGYSVGPVKVRKVLKSLGYSLQGNRRFFLDFSGKGEVRFRSFDLGTGRWIFAGIRSCVQ